MFPVACWRGGPSLKEMVSSSVIMDGFVGVMGVGGTVLDWAEMGISVDGCLLKRGFDVGFRGL